jgi:hypothetical protein
VFVEACIMRGYQPAQSLPVREIRGGYNTAFLEALKSMVVWRSLLEAGYQKEETT